MQADIFSSQNLYEKLKTNHILADVPNSYKSDMAEKAKIEQRKQGDIIIKQSDPANDFFYIIDGQVRAIDLTTDPPQLLNYMHDGEFFGELALREKKPRAATVDVVVDVTVARFSKETWDDLTTRYPQVLEEFGKLSQKYEEHRSIGFPGRQTDEVGIININRHILALFINIPGPLSAILLGLVIGWLLTDLEVFTPQINYGIITGLFTTLGILWMVFEYVEWVNDDFIVSSKRLIHIERTIIAGEHREETPLTQVNDIEVNTPNFFTRAFGYSNVIIKTAGLGSLVFDGIKDGDIVKNTIMNQVTQAKERVQAADISSIRKSLAGQIGWEGGPLEAKPLEVVDTTNGKTKQAFKLPRLLRYYIPQIRQETSAGVTWRKHPWIWLQSVWLPALVGIIAFYFLLASILGVFPFEAFSPQSALFFVVVTVFVSLWYTYQHDDWHKDIYMVTDSKIVHQDSTAFRLRGEEIRETTFDNVQTIDYESPNFIAKMINIGNVVIKTATVGEAFVFEDVYYPRDVQQEIFGRWVQFKETQRKRERAHEEERFTTWLGEYHAMAIENNPQKHP